MVTIKSTCYTTRSIRKRHSYSDIQNLIALDQQILNPLEALKSFTENQYVPQERMSGSYFSFYNIIAYFNQDYEVVVARLAYSLSFFLLHLGPLSTIT